MANRFKWKKGDVQVSQCASCKEKLTGAFCRAFTGGIPIRILKNEFDHTKPYPGDGGIRYSRRVAKKRPRLSKSR